jgi:hypothetical protein
VAGRWLKIRTEEGEWVNGWRVESVGARRGSSYLDLKSRDHLRQRRASDV